MSFKKQLPIDNSKTDSKILSQNSKNPNKDSEYQESSDSCSTKQILDDHSKDNIDVDSIEKTSDDEISEASGEIGELESHKNFNISATGSITDHLTDVQTNDLEYKNLGKITEVESEAVAENLFDSESDINYKISSKNSENSEKDIEANADESEAKSEHLFHSKSVENHIKPEKCQKFVEHPHDITTRLGIDRNYVIEDEIQNLQVTLVPIMTPAHLTLPCSFEEKTLLRPQSPVCDFIQKVLLESYV